MGSSYSKPVGVIEKRASLIKQNDSEKKDVTIETRRPLYPG
jgi:hypothetical protein